MFIVSPALKRTSHLPVLDVIPGSQVAAGCSRGVLGETAIAVRRVALLADDDAATVCSQKLRAIPVPRCPR